MQGMPCVCAETLFKWQNASGLHDFATTNWCKISRELRTGILCCETVAAGMLEVEGSWLCTTPGADPHSKASVAEANLLASLLCLPAVCSL